MKNFELPLSARELIPHRETMLLIGQLLSYDRKQGSGRISVCLSPETIFCDCGVSGAADFLEEVVVLEMMAQSYACLRGYEDRLAGCPPSLGFLVGVRHFVSHRRVAIGTELTIEVVTTIQLDDFFIADAAVKSEAETVAAAELKIWVPPIEKN
jgi:predicted hotdog family 3-hydroxylacyl-ACP dehydratase